ncbi:hypothetical protein [Pimelobacter sp. 30-1]|uniref:hypothetical protein n=1 Tax=Pimelobacter sp. 30-1 TaxID=2004991 RepID=UPI001C05D765|nr:hypothetical protein [Pimelobacter sp. 30-1]
MKRIVAGLSVSLTFSTDPPSRSAGGRRRRIRTCRRRDERPSRTRLRDRRAGVTEE